MGLCLNWCDNICILGVALAFLAHFFLHYLYCKYFKLLIFMTYSSNFYIVYKYIVNFIQRKPLNVLCANSWSKWKTLGVQIGVTLLAYIYLGFVCTTYISDIKGRLFQVNIIRIGQQLEYYAEYQKRVAALIGSEKAKQLVKEALVLITIGGNDFVNNYYLVPFSMRARQYILPDYVSYVISEYKNVLKVTINTFSSEYIHACCKLKNYVFFFYPTIGTVKQYYSSYC